MSSTDKRIAIVVDASLAIGLIANTVATIAVGLGAVELWGTKDEGQSWVLYAYDTKPQESGSTPRQKRTLELRTKNGYEEGIYGFRLVLKNPLKLGKAPPSPGDAPELTHTPRIHDARPRRIQWIPTRRGHGHDPGHRRLRSRRGGQPRTGWGDPRPP